MTIAPIDITHKVLVTPLVVERVKSLNSNFSLLIDELLHFFADTYRDLFHFEHPPLHDPIAVAFAIEPSIFTDQRLVRVQVETGDSVCKGRTDIDIFKMSKKKPNVNVLMDLNIEKFWDLMLVALTKADKHSPLNHPSRERKIKEIEIELK